MAIYLIFQPFSRINRKSRGQRGNIFFAALATSLAQAMEAIAVTPERARASAIIIINSEPGLNQDLYFDARKILTFE